MNEGHTLPMTCLIAMQKVEGSNRFSRFERDLALGRASPLSWSRAHRQGRGRPMPSIREVPLEPEDRPDLFARRRVAILSCTALEPRFALDPTKEIDDEQDQDDDDE